jgi:uncharacterized protein (TIGR00299 family) protein
MLLGALADAGVPLEVFEDVAVRLKLEGVTLPVREVTRHGFRACLVEVEWPHHHHHHHVHLDQILGRIQASGLPPRVQERAARAFNLLAQAEARVHGTTTQEVHFHEVGAVDALVDIVGGMAGLEHLGVDQVFASALPLGTGFVDCAHGRIPLPAPAVVELLPGVPVYGAGREGETVTPTGLAILKGLEARFGTPPDLRVTARGCGAGSHDLGLPGPLRLLVGQGAASWAGEREVNVEIRANIDDMNPQWFEAAFARIFEAGALDVYLTPVIMKKGRPAHVLTALAREADAEAVTRAILTHTRSIGVRRHLVEKSMLQRNMMAVPTPYGEVPVKVVYADGQPLRAMPEYDVVRKLAEAAGVPLEQVAAAAERGAQDLVRRSG